MTLAKNQGPAEEGGWIYRSQLKALMRLLTNIVNESARFRNHVSDHFRKYGVLLEAILKIVERIEQQNNHIIGYQELQCEDNSRHEALLEHLDERQERIHKLGMWWEEKQD